MISMKVKNKDKLKILNDLIIKVEEDKNLMSKNEFIKYSNDEQLVHIEEIKSNMIKIEKLNKEINYLIDYAPDTSDKLYLTEIFDIEKPNFGSNNLILAPVGSGKSTLINERLIPNKEHTVLMLVSNNALKDNLAPASNEKRKELSNRMFTTQNNDAFGNKKYKIHLMTYSEFGERIYIDNSFMDNIKQVFCDEIHSLPEYIKYGTKTNGGLIHAQKFLFNKHEDIDIYYFTATDGNLQLMENDRPGTMDIVKTFDYRNHPNIKKYVARSKREIVHIEQIRQYLKDRKESFVYYNYKGFAFSRTISSLKEIERIVVEEGYNPLVLWSSNNEDHKMNKSQLKAREELLSTNKIPSPYNFLIFNSSMQEGWNLKDNSVKLAIMNTTNETEHIQALGRLRRDVDLLVYRTNEREIPADISVPEEYLGKPLTTKIKKDMCKELGIIGDSGTILTWRGVKKVLVENRYKVYDSSIRVDGKVVKVSTITK